MSERSKNLLHKTHKADFEAFMIRHGFESAATRGDFEVLRFRRPDVREPIIVYDRIGGDHFTTFGAGTDWARRFYDNKRNMKLLEEGVDDDVPF